MGLLVQLKGSRLRRSYGRVSCDGITVAISLVEGNENADGFPIMSMVVGQDEGSAATFFLLDVFTNLSVIVLQRVSLQHGTSANESYSEVQSPNIAESWRSIPELVDQQSTAVGTGDTHSQFGILIDGNPVKLSHVDGYTSDLLL
jgi:hypothetical protein